MSYVNITHKRYEVKINQTSNTLGINSLTYWWQYWRHLLGFLWTGMNYQNYLISSLYDRRRITITGRDFATNYIPQTSTASFKLQNDSDLIIADAPDHLWFNPAGNLKVVTPQLLYDPDYTRTIVLCGHASPYNIYAIGILRSGVILTSAQLDQLHHDFELWLFWSGIWNDNGFWKDNKIMP